jgi:acetyl esterase/lipase
MTAGRSRISSVAAVGNETAWTGLEIPVAGRPPLAARVYGRRDGARALILHFHGGAFVGGDLESGSLVARLLADAGSVVVSLDYPLAPAHPFPQPLEAGQAALEWLYRNRRRLGGDGAALLVAGEEAGGNLAAAVALIARDRQFPPLAGQILLSPMMDPCVGTASLRNADRDAADCPWASGWTQYLPRAVDAGHPYAVPSICRRLAQLPATLMITAGDDPLRDEALTYATRLREVGVAVEQAVVDGPTGWPQSFTQGASYGASWAATVRDRLRSFIAARSPAVPPPAAA